VPLRADLSGTTAAILVGGLGTRLAPVVGDLPKALAPVAGVPFLDRLLGRLAAWGLRDVVLCTGVGADRVAAHCGDGARWGLSLRLSREETPLGTGGALRHARGFLSTSPFLVFNGDSLADTDPAALVAFHRQRRAAATLLLVRVADRTRFGSVRLDADGRIAAFEEKGVAGAGLINAGVYALEPGVLDPIPAGRPVSLESDVFPALVGQGLFGLATDARFIDIGTPDSYKQAEAFFS